MVASIHIDIGGTFTDCFINVGGEVAYGKSPTTRFNAFLGVRKSMEETARKFDLSLEQLLKKTEVISYSTTISTNTLIERSGPRLGLITTMGFEDTIYIGRGRQWGDGLNPNEIRNLAATRKPEPIIPRHMVVGVRERVDFSGKVLMPLNGEEVLEKVQYLVEKGVMGFVVSLLWSFMNPVHERMIKEIIEEEYPEIYLGNFPVVLSSDVMPTRGEYLRTITTVLNAYLHYDLSEELHNFRSELRKHKYRGPLLSVHNSGGITTVEKSLAVHTYGSSPVAGLMGGVSICSTNGIKNAVVTDMGGTSFDFGIIVDGKTRFYDMYPVIDRFRTSLPIMEMKTIGAGGGSVVTINPLSRRIEIGPKSAGSMPGPVCYGFGGTKPTVTDADLVLGYINPDYFFGGKLKLDKHLATRAIRESIAGPLGLEVEEAAALIKQIVDGNMGNEIYKEVSLRGYNPNEFAVFAYGGAGPTHCCGYSAEIGARKIYTFPFSSVFGAFGASTMNITHVYSHTRHMPLRDYSTEEYTSDYDTFNNTMKHLEDLAYNDLEGEGFQREEVEFTLELEMRYGSQLFHTVVQSPVISIIRESDVGMICESFEKTYASIYSSMSAYPQGGIEIELFRLRASVIRNNYSLPLFHTIKEDPGDAFKGERNVFREDTYKKTPVYERDRLTYGNIIEGPAIIEAADTTYVIPCGKRFVVDKFMNGVIEDIG